MLIHSLQGFRLERGPGLLDFAGQALAGAIAAPNNGVRMDSATVLTNLGSALTLVLSKIVEDKHPDLLTQDPAFPINTGAGSGLEAIVWRELHGAAVMSPIAGSARDIPMVQRSGEPQSSYVVPHAIGFGWSLQEMHRAAREGLALNDRDGKIARRAYLERIEEVFILGDPKYQVLGLINSKKIPRPRLTTSASDLTAFVPDSSSVTAAQILTCLNDWISAMATDSGEAFQPQGKTLVVTPRLWRKLHTTYLADTSPTINIATRLINDWGLAGIKQSLKLYNLAGTKTGVDTSLSSAVSFVALLDLSTMSMEGFIPHPFEMFPVQQVGLDFVVPCYAEIGDVAVYQPKAHRLGWYAHS